MDPVPTSRTIHLTGWLKKITLYILLDTTVQDWADDLGGPLMVNFRFPVQLCWERSIPKYLPKLLQGFS